MSMVALDLETTGLDMRQDKIIEIGMIRFDGARTERLSVKIPAGINEGQSIRLKGKAEGFEVLILNDLKR